MAQIQGSQLVAVFLNKYALTRYMCNHLANLVTRLTRPQVKSKKILDVAWLVIVVTVFSRRIAACRA